MHAHLRHHPPPDQAAGLRQRFGVDPARATPRVLAMVHNPFVVFGGVAMERLASALAERGLHTLVVDAAETASSPHELADVDLSACIEPLSARVSYLAACGLPKRWLDPQGGTGSFVTALLQAAPQADVLLLHAGATDIRRLYIGPMAVAAPLHPIVLAGSSADCLTHAYGAIKLLAQRASVFAFDLLALVETGSPKAERQALALAQRLADCAERFLDVSLRAWAAVDPASDDDDSPTPELLALLAAQLRPAAWPGNGSFATGAMSDPAIHTDVPERALVRARVPTGA